jgi:hypothetical protein
LPFAKILSQLQELKALGESQAIDGEHSLLNRKTGDSAGSICLSMAGTLNEDAIAMMSIALNADGANQGRAGRGASWSKLRSSFTGGVNKVFSDENRQKMDKVGDRVAGWLMGDRDSILDVPVKDREDAGNRLTGWLFNEDAPQTTVQNTAPAAPVTVAEPPAAPPQPKAPAAEPVGAGRIKACVLNFERRKGRRPTEDKDAPAATGLITVFNLRIVDSETGKEWASRKRYADFRKVKTAVGDAIAHVQLPKKESGQTDEKLESRYAFVKLYCVCEAVLWL